eukprot:95063_1
MSSSGYLPRGDRYMSVGYDESNDTILIVGGVKNNYQFVTFKNGTFTDYGENYTSYSIHDISQQYTQINNILWLISEWGEKLLAMQTYYPYTITDSNINIPTNVGYAGCLSSTKYEDHTYLFLLASGNCCDFTHILQIYNVTSNQWITNNIPSMLKGRGYFGCIAHKNRLYAIGGRNASQKHNTVESLYIGNDLINIEQQQWIYTNGYLSTGLAVSRAIAYGNDIIVFGGSGTDELKQTDINVIDTSTNTIKVDGSLAKAVGGAPAIIVDKIAYGFGAQFTGGIYFQKEYQYIFLPPTQNPTTAPSHAPTISPTLSPTKAPTNIFTDDEMRGMVIGSIIGAFLLSGVIYCCCQYCFIHIVIHKNSKYKHKNCISFCEWGGKTTGNVVLSLSIANNVDSVYKQITFMTIVTMIGGIADVVTDFVYAFK